MQDGDFEFIGELKMGRNGHVQKVVLWKKN
jgi:hypothetical protein